MKRASFLGLVALLGGCTFNVDAFALDVPSTAPEAPTTLRGDFSDVAGLSGFGVRVEGSPTTTSASAVVTVGGLLTAGADREAVRSGVRISWPEEASAPGTRRLVVGYEGPMLETVWTEGVTVSLPAATGLDLTLGSTSLEAVGVTGPIHAVADSGSIEVRAGGDFTLEATSGSIDVEGRAGSATCTSGSIALAATGAVVAHASSGSIDGTFGGGGEMGTSSGSIDVTLLGPLDRDLTLSASSGSIHLVVPPGTSMRVETHTGSGGSHVHVGGVESSDDFTGTIGSGGFLVRASTSSGSISIDER